MLSFNIDAYRSSIPVSILGVFIKDKGDAVLWANAVEYLNYTASIIFFMGLFFSVPVVLQGCGVTEILHEYVHWTSLDLAPSNCWVLGAFTALGATGVDCHVVIQCALGLYGHVSAKAKAGRYITLCERRANVIKDFILRSYSYLILCGNRGRSRACLSSNGEVSLIICAVSELTANFCW